MLRQILTSCLVILGLNSLVGDAVEFATFIASINETYAKFREFLFSILPLSVPAALQDYLIIGFAVAAAHMRSVSEHPSWLHKGKGKVFKIVSAILTVPFIALFWPFLVFMTVLVIPMSMRGEEIGYGTTGTGQPVAFAKYILITAGAFVVFLFVFSDFAHRFL